MHNFTPCYNVRSFGIFPHLAFMQASKGYLLFVVLLALCCTMNVALASDEGKPAPQFHAHLSDGNNVSNTSVTGKVVLLHFWATWCDGCRAEMPALNTYYQQHQKDGLQVVAISLDEAKDDALVQQVASQFLFPFAYERDSTHDAYGRVWIMPMTFVIDRNGILQKDGSAHPWVMTAATLDQIVTPLLSDH
jgi:peroxiredoxin